MENKKRLISLDEALKATHDEIYWTESTQASVRSFLVKQPKVDAVEVVHGRWKLIQPPTPDGWINSKTGEKVFPMCCSVCGDAYMNGPYKYCPSCGAKMDGGNNDED